MASRDDALQRFQSWRATRGQPRTREFNKSIHAMKIEAQWRADQSAKKANPDAMKRFEEWRAKHQAQKQRLAVAAGTALTGTARRSARAGTRPAPHLGMYYGQNAINAITRAVGRQRRR
jgi:hypothetical protein